jgi:hypothetical protein
MMGERVTGLLSCVILAVLAWSGCGPSYVMDTPDRFAHFDREKKFLKFISSDGVRVKVSSAKNSPYGEVAMWMGAVDNHLKAGGYHKVAVKEIATTGNMKGSLTEYLYRYNAESYVYTLALFADSEYLYIIEAGGVKKDFDRRRDGIFSAIRSFSVK